MLFLLTKLLETGTLPLARLDLSQYVESSRANCQVSAEDGKETMLVRCCIFCDLLSLVDQSQYLEVRQANVRNIFV